MTPGLPPHFHSKLLSPFLSLLAKSHKKTAITDQNWEWAESGLLWGKLIYLYSVSAGLNTHCFSFHSLYSPSPPSQPNSLFYFFCCFFTLLHDINLCHHFPLRNSEKDSSACIKKCSHTTTTTKKKVFHTSALSSDLQLALSGTNTQ